jgi:hypothetical protein
MWRNRKSPPIPDDIDEARAIRREADNYLANVTRQAPYVSRLTARLIERRELNHFGEQIQITFSPRGTSV